MDSGVIFPFLIPLLFLSMPKSSCEATVLPTSSATSRAKFRSTFPFLCVPLISSFPLSIKCNLVDQSVDGAQADVKRGQVRQEVVADEESAGDASVGSTSEVRARTRPRARPRWERASRAHVRKTKSSITRSSSHGKGCPSLVQQNSS